MLFIAGTSFVDSTSHASSSSACRAAHSSSSQGKDEVGSNGAGRSGQSHSCTCSSVSRLGKVLEDECGQLAEEVDQAEDEVAAGAHEEFVPGVAEELDPVNARADDVDHVDHVELVQVEAEGVAVGSSEATEFSAVDVKGDAMGQVELVQVGADDVSVGVCQPGRSQAGEDQDGPDWPSHPGAESLPWAE